MALTTWLATSTPTAANHNSTRRLANASPTRGQSVCQPIHVNRMALTPMRISLLTYVQLLFERFRSGLIEPAVLRVNHVHEQTVTSGLMDRRQSHRHIDAAA